MMKWKDYYCREWKEHQNFFNVIIIFHLFTILLKKMIFPIIESVFFGLQKKSRCGNNTLTSISDG